MGILIGWAARLVGAKFAPWLAYGLVFALLAGALLWLRHDAYTDGEAAEKTRWELALAKARLDAERAAGEAESAAGKRAVEFAEEVAQEKEKIDAAIESGTDPFDVLFPRE